MKWIDYREALGVSFSDSDKANMLASKIIVMFDGFSNLRMQDAEEEAVCRNYFSDVGEIKSSLYYAFYEVKGNIIKHKDLLGLVSHTIAFSNAAKKARREGFGEIVLKRLEDFLDEIKIDYEIIEDSDGCFIFPKGAKELDEANVNIPFEWLRDYPSARKAMGNALRSYSNMELPSQVADLFRKALETFAQEFFGKVTSLENLKTDFGKYLKEKGVPKELSNNFAAILQMYTNYMNNYAKHHDKTEKKCLEFIMYHTGNIIRFVISLSKE